MNGKGENKREDFIAHVSGIDDIQPEASSQLLRVQSWGVELAAYPYHYLGGFNGYPIEWRRLNSRTKLLAWVRHLSGKYWFSGAMCEAFIDAVAEHFGWAMEMP